MLAIIQKTFTASFAALALICVFGCLNWASATTLSDYQHRVSAAAALIEALHGAGEDESLQPELLITTNFSRVRQMLPAKETVTMDGQSLPVDNAWLHQELDAFERTNHGGTRIESLERIAERLRAIDERLSEMKRREAGATDKEADKGRLAEILRRPEYLQTAPEGNVAEQLLGRFLRWLSRLFPSVKPIKPGGGAGWISTFAQIFIVGICVAGIALLIWRYGPRFMKGRRKKKTKREARIVLGERLEPDQTAADLLAQADALARSGDLRAAIRKAYIALLCELGDRKLISLAQHKTNRDYLYSVKDKISLYSSMRKLTTRFELHWYGLAPAAESDWNDFRNDYQRIIRS